MKNGILSLLLLWSAAMLAQAEERYPTALSLKEAQQYAVEHSYSVRDAQKELEKSRATIAETRAMGLPQLTTQFQYQYNAQIQRQPIEVGGQVQTVAFGVPHNNTFTFQYNQLVVDASYFVALQATKVVKETYNLRLEKAELEIVHDAAEAYYGLLISQRLVEVLKENSESIETNLFEVRKLYENGFVEEQDVDQLELINNNITTSLNNANRQVELARMLLNFNLGIPVEHQVELTTSLDELIVSEEALGQEDFQVEEHIAFREIASQARGAGLQLKNEKAKYYPKLSGFVRHQQNVFDQNVEDVWTFDTYWIPSTVIGATVSWDILQGLGRPAKVKKARLDLERTEVAKKLTRNQLKMQYEQSRSNYLNALSNYRNLQKNVEISKSIRDKTLTKFNEGLSSSLDITQAQNQYLEAEQQSLQALQNILSAKEELEEALGKR